MNDTIEYVQNRLFEMQDLKYRDFQNKLIPTVDTETIIGVRTPELRALAKELIRSGKAAAAVDTNNKISFADSCAAQFIKELPHQYFDENQLHAFIISEMKDYDDCMEEICRFLPYVDNWATCDQMSPKVFRKHRAELLEQIRRWLCSECTYTVRFAVGMLMEHFLDDDFDSEYLEVVSRIRSDEYYVNMMTAWYFATALAKQWDAAVPYIEERRLDQWTHNKAIQKAIESRRITPEQKEYLRCLKY